MEVETQCIIAKNLKMMSEENFMKVTNMIEEISRIIFYLAKGLKKDNKETKVTE